MTEQKTMLDIRYSQLEAGAPTFMRFFGFPNNLRPLVVEGLLEAATDAPTTEEIEQTSTNYGKVKDLERRYVVLGRNFADSITPLLGESEIAHRNRVLSSEQVFMAIINNVSRETIIKGLKLLTNVLRLEKQ